MGKHSAPTVGFVAYIKVGGSYQLVRDYAVQTRLRPDEDIFTDRITLLRTGLLLIRAGYCWDGTSGPVIDRDSNMRAGCGHDGLYQLMRMGLLPHDNWRRADYDFGRWLQQDGAWKITVKTDLAGLKLARGRAALPKNRKKRHRAPRA